MVYIVCDTNEKGSIKQSERSSRGEGEQYMYRLGRQKLKLRDSSAFSLYNGNVAGIIYLDFTVLGQNRWGKNVADEMA